MEISKLKKGDIVLFKDKDVGVVIKVSETFLHSHSYIKIKYFSRNCGEVFVDNLKVYSHETVEIKRVIGSVFD